MNEVPFTRGQQLWWLTTGYGWKRRIPATFIEASKSGKRYYVRIQTSTGRMWTTFVTPRKLIARLPTDGEPVKW